MATAMAAAKVTALLTVFHYGWIRNMGEGPYRMLMKIEKLGSLQIWCTSECISQATHYAAWSGNLWD